MAGYLGDRFSKQKVIVYLKFLELPLMLMGVAGILIGNVYFLFFVVALTGCQCALFGPAKFGSLPEILRPDKISAGNGLMWFATVIATAMGFVVAGLLDKHAKADLRYGISFDQIWLVAVFLIGMAIVGWMFTLLIKPLPPADPHRKLPKNPVVEKLANLNTLYRNRPLFLAALGMAYFWLLGSMAQSGVVEFGKNELQLFDHELWKLQVMLILGVASGSIIAGLWSAGKVELGIVTIGATGMALSETLLAAVGWTTEPPSKEHLQQTEIRLEQKKAEAREAQSEKRKNRDAAVRPNDSANSSATAESSVASAP